MIRGSLLALLGIASFVAVYVAMAPRVQHPGPIPPASADAPAQTISVDQPSPRKELPSIAFELRPDVEEQANAEADPAAVAPSTVRDVTPPEMTAGPQATGPLARIDPPRPEPQARVERQFKPIVAAAGTIKVRGRDIRLAGIAAPEFDARCGEGAAAWPCGRMARAALRRFIRGRAIECDVPAGGDDIPDPATCRVAGDDIAAWLVAQGWAKRAGDLYSQEEDAARTAKLGLWGEGRPGDQAEVAANG
jgi:endonuclease YncB( thermonuclease family)